MGEKLVSIDEMLTYAGEFGRFQWIITTLLCLINFYGSQVMIMYFAALSPPWKCADNSSVCLSNETFSNNNNQRCSMNRSEWIFTESKDFSVTTQFDLVCDDEWLISLTSSIFFVGWMVGGVVFGWFADNFGRKTVFFPSTVLLIIVGFSTSFSPNITTLLALRFFAGFIVPGTFVQAFVIITEYTGTRYRPAAGNIYLLFFAVAVCQIGIVAYFVRQWKYLFVLCTVPYSFAIFLFPFIPESARWLLLQGKKEKVSKIFEKVARCNKRKIPEHVSLQSNNDRKSRKSNPLHLFNTKENAISTFAQGYAWMVIAMVFYGFSFAADDLGGSLYSNYLLVNAVGFPTALFVGILCDKFGRKKTVILSLVLASVACFLIAFIHNKHARVSIGMAGKFFASNSFNGVYIWSAEIFPTSTRSEGMGFLQFAARVGSALAPFVVKVLKKVHHTAPFISLGALGSIGFLILFVLPETKGKKVKDSGEHNKKEPQKASLPVDNIIVNTNVQNDSKL